jgi:hypothetical protein
MGAGIEAQLLASVPGSYKVCVAPVGDRADGGDAFTEYAAVLDVAAAGHCTFTADALPCVSEACVEDPTSEECVAIAAQYCAEHAEDGGCADLVPVYARQVGAATELTFYASEPGDLYFIPGDCG